MLVLQTFLLQSSRPQGHWHNVDVLILLEELKPVISKENDKEYMLTVQFCTGDNETLRKQVYCIVCASMRVVNERGKKRF